MWTIIFGLFLLTGVAAYIYLFNWVRTFPDQFFNIETKFSKADKEKKKNGIAP